MGEYWSNVIILYIYTILMICGFFMIICAKYLKKAKQYKEKISTLEENDLSKNQFDRTFDITCEYCGETFNTSNESCPKCEGTYHSNKQYLEERKKNNTEYYYYLQKMQKDIEEKMDSYCKMAKDLKRNIFVNHTCFDNEVMIPQRRTIEDVQIFCEYCGTKISLQIEEDASCPNCGSVCQENMELKAYKKMNEVIAIEHEKYLELNDIILNQNQKNKKFDALLTYHYWYAKCIYFLMIVIPIILVTWLTTIIPRNIIEKTSYVLMGLTQFLVYALVFYLVYIALHKKKKK